VISDNFIHHGILEDQNITAPLSSLIDPRNDREMTDDENRPGINSAFDEIHQALAVIRLRQAGRFRQGWMKRMSSPGDYPKVQSLNIFRSAPAGHRL
jgi:hypothetical protein